MEARIDRQGALYFYYRYRICVPQCVLRWMFFYQVVLVLAGAESAGVLESSDNSFGVALRREV